MKCLTDGCDKEKIRVRGLCGGCYQEVIRMVKKGDTTLEKLEALEMIFPAFRGKRTRSNLFHLSYMKKISELHDAKNIQGL